MNKLIAKSKKGIYEKHIKPIGANVENVRTVSENEGEEKPEKKERVKKDSNGEKKKKRKREERKPRRTQDEAKKNHEPDPAKISFYQEKIDFHTKKVQEFQDLLTKAQEMEKNVETPKE